MVKKSTILYESIDKRGIISKIIKKDDKKFKLYYECTNGTQSLSAYIMDSEGTWRLVITKFDIGDNFQFNASYVSDITQKSVDAKKGFLELEKIIKAIY
jgi:hypothetical protein